VETKSRLVLNDRQMLVDCAVEGLGLAFVSAQESRRAVAQGLLESFLQAYVPVDSGLYLYFPERSQSQLKLRVFIDMAREMAALPA
jgi:DNA-binding transcriptional LysR family regulator